MKQFYKPDPEISRETLIQQSIYLAGAADSMEAISPSFSKALADASEMLKQAGNSMCAQGYFGCRAGRTCASDHK